MQTIPGSLSIVVPAFNEADRLPSALPMIAAFCQGQPNVDVTFVNDGSLDDTGKVLDAFAHGRPYVRVIHNAVNQGKGYVVRQGMLEARREWILLTDADLSTPLAEVAALITAAAHAAASIAIGSRAVDRKTVGVHQSAAREWSGRLFNVAVRLITGLPFKDTQCGFKLYRRDAAAIVFSRQRLHGFGADVENLVTARVHGLRVVEVPVRWDNVESTRVTALSGGRTFLDLFTIRSNERSGRYQ